MADVEQRADVWMLQRRDSTRFTVEALAQLRIGGELRWQDLDRDRPIEPRVARAVDLAHAAGSERRDNLVWPETNAGRDVHGCRGLYAPKRKRRARRPASCDRESRRIPNPESLIPTF